MPHLTFENVYHNGLVERKGDSSLGPISGEDPKVYTDLVKTERRLKTVLKADEQRPGRKMYPDLLRAAMENEKFNKFRMLSRSDGHVPGFGPDDDLRIEVLGPIVETNELGKAGLRRLGATGITKNGHSVVLRLVLGNLRVLLGGDLNVPSEELLLETVVGREIPTAKAARAKFLREARELLEVDVAKSCHHGSADFSGLFLEAVNPIATVISSGDAEPHSHPRAETLGAIGVSSRGDRPLIYSTELARSVKESIRNPAEERKRIMELSDAMAAESDRTKRAKRRKALKKYVDNTINRTVQTYGAIYLRSDGERAVIGHKYESNSPRKMWDINTLEPDADGRLHFHSHHH